MKTFSEKLTEFIRQKGLSKQEFGEKIGSGRQAVLNYTNGREPSLAFLQKILTEYPDFDLNYFLKDSIVSPQKLTKVNRTDINLDTSIEFQKSIIEKLDKIENLNQEILNKFDH